MPLQSPSFSLEKIEMMSEKALSQESKRQSRKAKKKKQTERKAKEDFRNSPSLIQLQCRTP